MAGVEGRVALVTGASQGIGRACALVLAAGGAKVALCARNQEKLQQVAAEIAAQGAECDVFKMDVVNEEEIKAGVKAIQARFGTIDILVNNAGVTRDQLMMRMKRADWDDVINTNLTGPFLLSQAVISSMLKQRWGRIINVTSIFGQIGQAGQTNYASSKAGLIGLTMSLAREVASRSITVNAVAPGWIETAMTSALSEELKEKMRSAVPLGRTGTDMDVAHAVKFLASEEAGYITGEVLKVNGGILMGEAAMSGAAEIVEVATAEQLEAVKSLFRSYQEQLFSKCQLPDSEWQSLPGMYAPPSGGLLLALVSGQPAGCVALRPFPQEHTCEMKRLFVVPPFRGSGAGRALIQSVIAMARDRGYAFMRLDTHPATMAAAVQIYRQFGFQEVSADPLAPVDGLSYMELGL